MQFARRAGWYVFAGGVTSFLLAWSIALLVRPHHTDWLPSEQYDVASDSYWRVFINRSHGWTVIHSVWDSRPLYRSSEVQTPHEAIPRWAISTLQTSEFQKQRMIYGAGWPLPVCWCEHDSPVGFGSVVSPDGAIPIKIAPWDFAHYQLNRTFPIRMIWTNLILNAFAFAIVLPIPLRLIRLGRGYIRRWKGRCHRCGYPRGVNQLCTECGARLKHRLIEQ